MQLTGILKKLAVLMLAAMTLAVPAWAISKNSTLSQGHELRKASPTYVPGELLVRFKPGSTVEQRETMSLRAGAVTIKRHEQIGVEHVRLPKEMSVEDGMALYLADPAVEFAEPNYILRAKVVPNDPLFTDLWGLNNAGQTGGLSDADMDVAEAWAISTGATSVVVAIIDTGIDYNHPDLAANIWLNPSECVGTTGVDDDANGFIDDCRGWDFYEDDNDPMDVAGHGTHVAGTVGAIGNNSYGSTGVAWYVKLMPVRMLGPSGEGSTSDAINAIRYADKMGADVVNCSWGASGVYSQALKDAIDSSSALFVCAAGNDYGLDTDTTSHSPSSFDSLNLISVAATDHDDLLTDFSNYGVVSVDVGAPGALINSTVPGRRVLFSDDFDSDTIVSPLTTGGTNDSWTISNSISNSPANSLSDSSGNYLNNTNSWAMTPGVDLTGYSGCLFNYQIRFVLESFYDYLCPQASTSSTTGFKDLGGNWGYGCWTGSTQSNFLDVSEDLTAYDGKTVYSRFLILSDFSEVRDGAYLDDVSVTCASDATFPYAGTEYERHDGTSMAAPHVSGVAALLIANIPSLTSLETKHLILETVDQTGSLIGKSVTGGRVNALSALSTNLSQLSPVLPTKLREVSTTQHTITLAWTDNSGYESGFYLERTAIGNSSAFIQIANIPADTTTYQETGLPLGTSFTYRVRAYNANGTSDYSNELATGTNYKPVKDGGDGCFIATAAYGSPMAKEVETLSRFRDTHLLTNAPGRKLVELYYRYSPPAARYIAERPALRAVARTGLAPIVFTVKHPVWSGMFGLFVLAASFGAAIHLKRRRSCN